MASERDRCPAHVDGIPDRLYLRKEPDAYDWVHDQAPGIEPDETEYIRSDLAEQREAELVELLRVARCPDSSNASHGAHPCPWCHERDSILAKHKAEGREGS